MSTFANSEDPDEMPHEAAFHEGLHCSLRLNQSLEIEVYFLEIITCDPSIYTMDHPNLTVSNFMGNFIGLKKVNPIIPMKSSIQFDIKHHNDIFIFSKQNRGS